MAAGKRFVGAHHPLSLILECIDMILRFYLPVLSCIFFFPLGHALSNVTVDSSDDAMVYWPPSSWIANGSENTTSVPDFRQASNGTWQFASTSLVNGTIDSVSLSMTFKGTAVYVFAILQREALTAVDFSINGTLAGSYNHVPDTTAAFLYNSAVYANSSLPLGEHVLNISLSQADGSVFYLDNIVFGTRALSQHGAISPSPPSTEAVPSSPSAIPLTIIGPEVGLTSPTSTIVTTFSLEGPMSPLVTSPGAPTDLEGTISVTTITSEIGMPTRTGESSDSPPTSPSVHSPEHNVIIIAAVAGSVGVATILLLLVCLYMRYKRTRKFRVEPYVSPRTTPSPSPNDQDIFTKLPTSSASSTRPFLKRLSFQTMAESTATGLTLTDEIFPLPSEMDDVYGQLEALSAEVQKFRETDSVMDEERWSQRRTRIVTQDVHASIDQLRSEIQRLRRRSGATGTTGDSNLLNMLREIDLLRAELHEVVVEADNDPSVERLPSYHSRKNVCVNTQETPPPLPTTHAKKLRR